MVVSGGAAALAVWVVAAVHSPGLARWAAQVVSVVSVVPGGLALRGLPGVVLVVAAGIPAPVVSVALAEQAGMPRRAIGLGMGVLAVVAVMPGHRVMAVTAVTAMASIPTGVPVVLGAIRALAVGAVPEVQQDRVVRLVRPVPGASRGRSLSPAVTVARAGREPIPRLPGWPAATVLPGAMPGMSAMAGGGPLGAVAVRALLVAPVAEKQQKRTPGGPEATGLDRLGEVRSTVPAVTHVDYSARVQTVSRETNPRFHRLLRSFKARTGCPLLINTSFNVRGEPPVLTPEDAFACFMGTDLDRLVVGNCYLEKSSQPAGLLRRTSDDFEDD